MLILPGELLLPWLPVSCHLPQTTSSPGTLLHHCVHATSNEQHNGCAHRGSDEPSPGASITSLMFWAKNNTRSWRPGTGPQHGNSRQVLAEVLAQVLAKMGVLAGVLAQVLAVSVFQKGPACHSGQHHHFCQDLCQHFRQHFPAFPCWGPVPGRLDLKGF